MKYLAKSLFLLTVLVLFIASAPLFPAFAANKTVKVFIFEPSDTNPGGFDPEYAGTVTAVCNGISRNAVFQGGNAPEYHAVFTDSECPTYSVITATAFNGEGESGSGSGTMPGSEGFINFNLTPNVSVPEFGMIPMLVAAAGSVGAYLTFKKRLI